MDDTQFRAILAEMKESNKLMKAMVSELSQIKFELVNERMKRGYSTTTPAPFPRDPNGSTGASTFKVIQ
jgi:hypothetical protein